MPYSLGGIHEFVTEPAPNDWLVRLNPQWMVVVGSTEHADAINKTRNHVLQRKQLLPGTAIGVRWWDDDKIATRLIRRFNGDVEAAADYYAQTYFPLHVAGTWLLVGNEEEASKTDASVFASVVAFHAAVAKRANAAGIPCGLCCTAMGEPEYGQYELLVPLFREMAKGWKDKPEAQRIYHIWRPNTYFPHSQGMSLAEREALRFHLSQRHQREGREVAAAAGVEFPLLAFGEFNTVVSLANNLDGPNSIPDYTDDEWMDDLLWSDVEDPFAVYCHGDGLYDARWTSFDLHLRPDYMEAMVQRLPRRNGTLIEEWKKTVTVPPPVAVPPVPGKPQAMVVASATGLKHRAAPSLSAATLRTLANKQPVTAYPDSQVVRDGYTWYYCLTANGESGWSANNWLVPVLPPEVWTVRLDAPFVSQLGITAARSPNDCRVAVYLMQWRYWLMTKGATEPSVPTVDDLVKYTRLALTPPPKGLLFADVDALAKMTGFDLDYVQPARIETIVSYIDAGKPVSVLVDYSKINIGHAPIAHEMLVIGYSQNAFLLHDPYLLGENVTVPKTQLETAMKTTPENSAQYQAMVLKAG